MPFTTLARPTAGEHASFYGRYIALVKGHDAMRGITQGVSVFLADLVIRLTDLLRADTEFPGLDADLIELLGVVADRGVSSSLHGFENRPDGGFDLATMEVGARHDLLDRCLECPI